MEYNRKQRNNLRENNAAAAIWNQCFISSCMCWRNPIGITVWFQFGKLSTNFRTIAAKSERTSNGNDQTQHTAKLDRSMEPATCHAPCTCRPSSNRRVTPCSQRASKQQQWHYYDWMTFYRISLADDRGNANGNGRLSPFLGGGTVRGSENPIPFYNSSHFICKFVSATRFRRFRVHFNEIRGLFLL